MGRFLRAFLQVSVFAAGFWSLGQWRGADSIFAFPETAIVVLITGASVLAAGARYALSLWLRCGAALGLVDLALRASLPLLSYTGDGTAFRVAATAIVVGAIFLAVQRLDWKRPSGWWDAPVFFFVGALFVAIATRDAMGAEAWPYTPGNAGIWVLLALAATTAVNRIWPLRSSRELRLDR